MYSLCSHVYTVYTVHCIDFTVLYCTAIDELMQCPFDYSHSQINLLIYLGVREKHTQIEELQLFESADKLSLSAT